MDNLDHFQKLVSTQWTFSILISILIGLERRDPHAYILGHFCEKKYFRNDYLIPNLFHSIFV